MYSKDTTLRSENLEWKPGDLGKGTGRDRVVSRGKTSVWSGWSRKALVCFRKNEAAGGLDQNEQRGEWQDVK